MLPALWKLSGGGGRQKNKSRQHSVADISVQERHRAGMEEAVNSPQECEGLMEEEQFDVDLE